jgi:hypothetical protein
VQADLIAEAPRCKYYGQSHIVFQRTGKLLGQHGNECALIFSSFAPCKMELAGAEPDEEFCPIVARHNAPF